LAPWSTAIRGGPPLATRSAPQAESETLTAILTVALAATLAENLAVALAAAQVVQSAMPVLP